MIELLPGRAVEYSKSSCELAFKTLVLSILTQ